MEEYQTQHNSIDISRILVQAGLVSTVDIQKAQQFMIMSVSGWRKVFAPSEENADSNLIPADIVLVGFIALSFVDFLREEWNRPLEAGRQAGADIQAEQGAPCFILGRDSRPTGSSIADIFIRIAAHAGLEPRYIGVAASPEIMAMASLSAGVHAFAYISASHNPVGHNGFKFGLANGSVLSAQHMEKLSRMFHKHLEASHERVYSILSQGSESARMRNIYQNTEEHKRTALRCYQALNEQTIGSVENTAPNNTRLSQNNSHSHGHNSSNSNATISRIRSSLRTAPIGIVGELNGSARSLSIDRSFLEGLGARVRLVNDRAGDIVHGIIPEGENLALCRIELEKAHRADPIFQLGYVPDNDGDRGNIVYIDKGGHAHILDAQTLFALVALSESAFAEYSAEQVAGNSLPATPAIVVNGPTSMRINEIAETFGLNCVRTEVGEAHLIARSEELRSQGVPVILAGEGSNGGCIIPPSSVRDPLCCLASILKLLCIRDSDVAGAGSEDLSAGAGLGDVGADRVDGASSAPPVQPAYTSASSPSQSTAPPTPSLGLFHRYCRHRGLDYDPNFTLQDLINSLPAYTTTSASEKISIMRIQSSDPALFKAEWERIFLEEWDRRKALLAERWGISEWQEYNTEGTQERQGFGSEFRSAAQRGGLKVLFRGTDEQRQASIWMRGSGTEALFRLIVDVKGDRPDLEEYLLLWQRSMIERADKASG